MLCLAWVLNWSDHSQQLLLMREAESNATYNYRRLGISFHVGALIGPKYALVLVQDVH